MVCQRCLIISQVDLLSGPLPPTDALLFSLLEICRYTILEHPYYNEMDIILTLLNWWQPLVVHGVRVVPLLIEGK